MTNHHEHSVDARLMGHKKCPEFGVERRRRSSSDKFKLRLYLRYRWYIRRCLSDRKFIYNTRSQLCKKKVAIAEPISILVFIVTRWIDKYGLTVTTDKMKVTLLTNTMPS